LGFDGADTVLDANEYVHRFEAAIDTGFNGELTLPPLHVQELGLAPALPLAITMANHETETFDTYHGTILWRGARFPVRIVASEGTPLIGIGLLWGSLLTAEIIDNGEVTVSPLPEA
jgi:predicted aspartyl protease